MNILTPDTTLLLSSSPRQTKEAAANLAGKTVPGAVIALLGNLGAGKTVFAKGFAEGLGIEEPVSSPTFTVVREYKVPTAGNTKIKWLFHLDLYRIADSPEALAFGIDDYFSDKESVSLVEWPERISNILPQNTLFVELKHLSPDKRSIELKTDWTPQNL